MADGGWPAEQVTGDTVTAHCPLSTAHCSFAFTKFDSMKKHLLSLFVIIFSLHGYTQKSSSNLQYVDPTIGGVGLILEPTRPTVHIPNSMVRVFPARKDQLD